MVKLLMRFYDDVNDGAILVDGHNVKDFNRREPKRFNLEWFFRIHGSIRVQLQGKYQIRKA